MTRMGDQQWINRTTKRDKNHRIEIVVARSDVGPRPAPATKFDDDWGLSYACRNGEKSSLKDLQVEGNIFQRHRNLQKHQKKTYRKTSWKPSRHLENSCLTFWGHPKNATTGKMVRTTEGIQKYGGNQKRPRCSCSKSWSMAIANFTYTSAI